MRFSAYPLDQQMCKFLVSLGIPKCLTDIDTRNDFLLIHILLSAPFIHKVQQTGARLNPSFTTASLIQRAQLGLASYQPSSRGGKNNTLSSLDVKKINYTGGIIIQLSFSNTKSSIDNKRNNVSRTWWLKPKPKYSVFLITNIDPKIFFYTDWKLHS